MPDLPVFQDIRVEPDAEVVTIVLDRPEVLNAMSGRLRVELAQALDLVAAGPWQAMILRGAGRAFSAGADLGSYLDDTALRREGEGIVARVASPAFQAGVAPYRQSP